MMNMCLGAMGPDASSLMNESYERKTHQKISAGLSAVTLIQRNYLGNSENWNFSKGNLENVSSNSD